MKTGYKSTFYSSFKNSNFNKPILLLFRCNIFHDRAKMNFIFSDSKFALVIMVLPDHNQNLSQSIYKKPV